MALTRSSNYQFAGPFTVTEFLQIADEIRQLEMPADTEIRVLTRVGFSRDGSAVRALNFVPAARTQPKPSDQ